MQNKNLTKIISFIMAITVSLSVFTGCSKPTPLNDSSGNTSGIVNTSYEEGMDFLTVTGKTVKGDNLQIVPFPALGFAQLIPESWGTMDYLNFVVVDQGICMTVIPPSKMPDMNNISDEDMDSIDVDALFSIQLNFVKIFYVSSSMSEADVIAANSNYKKVEKLATLEDHTYYIAYNDTVSQTDHPELTQEDMDTYASYAAELPAFRDNMMIFPIQQLSYEEGITSEQVKSIRGTDMNGKPVDAGIFADYELTMINIWATWCGPCVDELPDLAKLYQNLPKNVNMITICSDGAEEKETAESFLEQCNAKFITICGDDAVRSSILKNVYSYPTTIFVDKNGNLVGEALLGSLSADDYQKEIATRMK